MRLKIITLLIIIFNVCLCNAQNKTVWVRNYYNSPRKFETELKEKITYDGDTIAYKKLKSIYIDTLELKEDFFYYAFIMAKVLNYTQAYYDVFTCFMDFYPYKERNMDNETATMTIDFLLDAAERGNQQAQILVEKYTITRGKKNNRNYIKRIIKGEGLPLYWKEK